MKRILPTTIVCAIVWGISCSPGPIKRPADFVRYENDNEIHCGDFTLIKNLEFGMRSGVKAPVAGHVDRFGNIYVLNKGDDRILVYTKDGKWAQTITNLVDKNTTAPIIDFAIDNQGSIYLIDLDRITNKAAVRKITIASDGSSSFEIPLPPDRLIVTNRYALVSDSSCQNDYLVYAFSNDGKALFGIEKVKKQADPQDTLVQNRINLGVDKKGNIYLAYRFFPKVLAFSQEGKRLWEFTYLPQIRNRRKPVEITTAQKNGYFEKRSAENPVCTDILIDKHGMICLLVAADHSQPGRNALYLLDSSGAFKYKAELPFYCTGLFMDGRGGYYFLSPSTVKPLVKYSRATDATMNGDRAREKEADVQAISPALTERLAFVLKECAAYSERLNRASLDFVCEEEITEIMDISRDLQIKYGREYLEKLPLLPREIKSRYLYDYQLIRKNGKIQETRILLKENGKNVNIKDAELKTSAFTYQDVIFGPRVFHERWRPFHDYQIIGEGILNSRRALIIEVTPKTSEKDGVLSATARTWLMAGRVWVDENDYSVLRIEMDKRSISDEWKIDEKALMYESEPLVMMTCEYDIEKNGVRFPSRFSIEECYVNHSGQRFVRARISVTYRNYKYFTVETNVSRSPDAADERRSGGLAPSVESASSKHR